MSFKTPHNITGLNADLHCHSVISDGTLEPETLALRAQMHGVQLWSLTDHDEVSGQQRAAQAAKNLGLPYLCGTEISVTFLGQTVHILGLGINPEDTQLQQGLQHTRSGRDQRARQMAQALAEVGVEGAYEGALKFASNPNLLSRMHFARFLVETGVCQDAHTVFRKYLTAGKPGYAPHCWAALGDAVHWIIQAQGVAVIAHPARYALTASEEYALLSEFKDHGGRGIEVMTGSHSALEVALYARTAEKFGLAASRGSDFHSPEESRTELGSLPLLPEHLTPVWSLLQERIHQP